MLDSRRNLKTARQGSTSGSTGSLALKAAEARAQADKT
jgi:hypothetical protein